MKIKLTTAELSIANGIIGKLADDILAQVRLTSQSGGLHADDLLQRMQALALDELAQKHARYIRGIGATKPAIKFEARTGLALLAMWYRTDITELSMSPLAMAVMTKITTELERAYAGPIIAQR